MARLQASAKRIMIDKTNGRIVAITAIAAFVVVFALVASKTLISQAGYQNKVINADKKALDQLKSDLQATSTLVTSYQAFVGTSQNVLGGNPHGTGAKDGDNAQIILDSLPSQYDFPALATSLEKLLTSQQVQISGITGTDDELAQQAAKSSPTPAAVPMPFQISVTGDYQQIQSLIDAFGKSIRPFQIQNLQLSGDEGKMSLTLSAQTYYQPGKSFDITTKVMQ